MDAQIVSDGTASDSGSDRPTFDSATSKYTASLEKSQQLTRDYNNTGAARLGELVSAASLARLGKLDEAGAAYASLAADHPDDPLAGLAVLGQAQLEASRGNHATAETLLHQLSTTSSAYVPKDLVLLRLGDVHEQQNQLTKAVGAYQLIVDEHGDSQHAATARERLSALPAATPSETDAVSSKDVGIE